jgi:hypothetical protein
MSNSVSSSVILLDLTSADDNIHRKCNNYGVKILLFSLFNQ